MSAKCLPLTQVNPGMILAKPVVDDQGRTLCGAGTVLTDKMVARIERMGISVVHVQSDEKLSEEEFQKERQKIERRFSKISPSSFLHPLKNIFFQSLDAKKNPS